MQTNAVSVGANVVRSNQIQFVPSSIDFFALLEQAVFIQKSGLQTGDLGRALVAWKYGLIPHEIRLLEFIAEGLDNETIAEQVGIGEVNTVKKQISSLFKKLHVRNRVQAATIAACYGFLKEPADPHGDLNG